MKCRATTFIFLATLLSSCASLVNRPTIDVEIAANRPNSKIVYYGKSFDLPTTLHVKRSKEDLKFTVYSDSIERTMILKSKVGAPFIFGNLPTWFTGYLIDLTNPKRFEYGKKYSLNLDDTSTVLRARRRAFAFERSQNNTEDSNKGAITFLVTIPYLNLFYLRPVTEPHKSSTGVFGISIGAEYSYTNNKAIRATMGSVTDLGTIIPAPFHRTGEYETNRSNYYTLTKQIQRKDFVFGYGLSYSKNRWRQHYGYFGSIPSSAESRSKTNTLLGLAFSTHWHLTKGFALGLLYRPSLIRIHPTTNFMYEHVISVDFAFKLGVK